MIEQNKDKNRYKKTQLQNIIDFQQKIFDII